ncbi:hypothetical protein CCP3SC15_1430005 [Gammaproteobacteria bacterium]
MRKIEEVLRLHHECGRTNREIARSVGVSPSTVADYLRRAQLAGFGWPLAEGVSEAVLEAALFPLQPNRPGAAPEAGLGSGASTIGEVRGHPGMARKPERYSLGLFTHGCRASPVFVRISTFFI